MTQYSGKIIRKNAVVPTQQSASGVWTVTDAAAATRNNAWPVAGVPDPISRSVRIRSSASAYFNRTPASAGNRKTWTYSGWVKRGQISTSQGLIAATTGTAISFGFGTGAGNDQLFITVAGVGVGTTTPVFRDPSSWYHVVIAFDTTQAVAGNRVLVYVNGVNFPLSTTLVNQNTNYEINNASSQQIGTTGVSGGTTYFDGYLTEVNFIDGQALTPSSFGTTDAFTGAWVPMVYAGTYGTNGFYLNFKDNTSTTTLGYDYSGNSNNWTANNISLTAGVTYDSMLDVPTPWIGYNTDGGVSVTRGNYCVLNGANNGYGTTTLSQGNLYVVISAPGATEGMAVGTMGMTTGQWYWEVNVVSVNTTYSYPCSIGIGNLSTTTGVGMPITSYAYNSKDGNKLSSTGSFASAAYGASYTATNTIGVAFDADAGTLTFYKNGTSQGTAFTGIASSTWFPRVGSNDGCTLAFNFGQRPFSYTPPTGFKALCTTNLPEPTIKLGASYFAASTFTGTGAALSIVNSGNNTTATTFQPDFVWLKNRTIAYSHLLADSVRGATKYLVSSSVAAEATDANSLTAFNSNGFSVGPLVDINGSGNAIVGWNWKAGGAAMSNTNGTITSSVSANQTAGFSVVTYTGTGANATVGHGLGVAPALIIAKKRSGVSDWPVYNKNLTSAAYAVILNGTLAQTSIPSYWNSTAPTSSVFSVGTSGDVNTSGGTHVAYCFAEVAGYSKFGSYTGNGSADGPFVYLGFRPRFLMVKCSSNPGEWYMLDTSRSTYNVVNGYLIANQSSAEATGAILHDFLSNGFKVRDTVGSWNASGYTYIYMAFAENPFKYSNAR